MDWFSEIVQASQTLLELYSALRQEIVLQMFQNAKYYNHVILCERFSILADMVEFNQQQLEQFCCYLAFVEETGNFFSREDIELELQYHFMNYVLEDHYFLQILDFIRLSNLPLEDFITEECFEKNEENSKFYQEKLLENQKCLQLIKEERGDIFE